LFVLPLLLLPIDTLWGLLLIPIAFMTNSFWALNHEAIHGNFHPRRRVNDLAGRSMSALLGSSFRVLRFAHLMHHRYNRFRLDRPVIYEPDEESPLMARMRSLSELLWLLYLSAVVVPLLFLLPKPLVRLIVDRVYRHPDPTVQAVKSVAERIF